MLVDFFNTAIIFELTSDIVYKTIQIRQKQKIKLPDAIIGATALVNGLVLISRNTKDFRNIKELEVIDPYNLLKKQ